MLRFVCFIFGSATGDAQRSRQGCLTAALSLLAVCLPATTSSLPAADGPTERAVALAQTRPEPISDTGSLATARPTPANHNQKPSNQKASDQQRSQAEITEGDREALEFIRQHQPKLLKLLEFLEKRQPALFAQAVKEMSRSQQRLESLAKRDPELYQVELQLWQVRSELRLLAAEMTVATQGRDSSTSQSPSSVRDEHLVKLVKQEAEYELTRLQLLKARTQKELARLDAQIGTLSASHDELVARKVQLWQNRINKSSRK